MDVTNKMPMTSRIKFESSDDLNSIIKVIGVGGGGSNAVSYMFNQGIQGVDFIICNTDRQSLETSPVMQKLQLGKNLTKGLGAGSKPEVGRNAALESADDLKALLSEDTRMLFITAGMGGGTGTGAAPVIAAIAKDLGILTVAIVTMPFSWEGRKKMEQAQNGISELKKNVDSLLLISNDKLREFYGNLSISNAFSKADDVLKVAAKGISDIVNKIGKVNVDFEDVNTVIRNSGVAIMGSGMAEGENRASDAIDIALSSPLLNDNNIKGASNILLYITSGSEEITMDEFENITQHIQKEAGLSAEIIWGICHDESLEKKIAITIVATGFDYNEITHTFDIKAKASIVKKNVMMLEEEKKTEVIENIIKEEKISDEEVMALKNRMIRKEENPILENKKGIAAHDLLDFDFINQVDEMAEPELSKDDHMDFIPVNDEIQETKDEDYPEPEMIISSKETIEEPVKEINVHENEKIESDIANEAHRERNRKLKELSQKIGNKLQNNIEMLEKEPAFRRKNVTLSNVPPANESRISRFTLGEDEEKNVEIRSNNSFLHDNVD